jgi:nitrous oxidase accessory protein NosD
MTAGSSLVVQNCAIANFPSYGLYISSSARVRLLDSLLRGNDYGAYLSAGASVLVSGSRFLDNTAQGLYVSTSGAGVVTRVEVSRSEASGSGGEGFSAAASASGRTELDLKDSVASRNEFGAYAYAQSGGTSLIMVSNSLISGNTTEGLTAYGSGAKLVASGNKVTHNGTGLAQATSGVLQSTGDNTVTDNTTPTSGTITSLANM